MFERINSGLEQENLRGEIFDDGKRFFHGKQVTLVPCTVWQRKIVVTFRFPEWEVLLAVD